MPQDSGPEFNKTLIKIFQNEDLPLNPPGNGSG
jgi:hypothetical protein